MRRAATLAAAVILSMTVQSPAGADPAGPTDYQSEIVSVVPPSAEVDFSMIGGDAFLRIAVAEGAELEVVGYRGEPYLRFHADGTVEINDNAPSTYLSEDRYGEVQVPASADADAEPSWRVVSREGTYAWHDHRTHWMNEARPAAQPGDQILEAVVPLVIDGVDTDITVISTWQQPPSPIPATVGVVAGALLATYVSRLAARVRAAFLIVLALLASGTAWMANASVPPETGPSNVLGMVALVAAGLAVYGLLRRGADAAVAVFAPALILGLWGFFRRDWMLRSILPTSIPTADRMITGLTLAAGALMALAAAYQLFAGSSRPQPEAP